MAKRVHVDADQRRESRNTDSPYKRHQLMTGDYDHPRFNDEGEHVPLFDVPILDESDFDVQIFNPELATLQSATELKKKYEARKKLILDWQKRVKIFLQENGRTSQQLQYIQEKQQTAIVELNAISMELPLIQSWIETNIKGDRRRS